jgi:hypothetical protein
VVSNLAPKRADHELLDKIAALSKDVKGLKRQQASEMQHVDIAVRRSSTAALRLSQETITSGRKLYRESIRSGTITRSSTDATLVDPGEPHDMENIHFYPGDDEDNEFAFEIAESTAKAAQAAFEREDWTATIAYIEELMHGIKRGSFRLSSTPAVASFDLIYMHAISTFHTDEPSAAQNRLVKAVEQRATTTDQRNKLHDAQHFLAVTYVRLSDLDAANDVCKRSLEGRRRLVGRQDEAFLESLGLMSRIHELQGNQFRAQIYLTMIPEARVDVIKAKYQSITHPEALDSYRDSGPVIPLLSNDLAGLGISNLRLNDFSHASELSDPSQPGAGESMVEGDHFPLRNRPQLFPVDTENVVLSGASDLSHGGTSPLLPSPPSTAIPVLGRGHGPNLHRRNQSAPLGSRTVPGSPLLPSPRALEPSSLPARPLGTTGLFRGVSNRTRRTWLAGLNIHPSGEIEKAVCKGDLMALHAALNRDSGFPGPPASKVGCVGRSRPRALHLAALFGDVRMAHAFIIAGFDVHSTIPKIAVPGRRLFAQQAPYESETALHLAIGSRQAPMVEYLLGQGASLYDGRFNLDLPTAHLLDIDWLRATQCASSQEVVDVLQVLFDADWALNRPLSLRGPERDSVMQSLSRHSNWPFETRAILSFCRELTSLSNERLSNSEAILETALEANDIEELEGFVDRNPHLRRQVRHA